MNQFTVALDNSILKIGLNILDKKERNFSRGLLVNVASESWVCLGSDFSLLDITKLNSMFVIIMIIIIYYLSLGHDVWCQMITVVTNGCMWCNSAHGHRGKQSTNHHRDVGLPFFSDLSEIKRCWNWGYVDVYLKLYCKSFGKYLTFISVIIIDDFLESHLKRYNLAINGLSHVKHSVWQEQSCTTHSSQSFAYD